MWIPAFDRFLDKWFWSYQIHDNIRNQTFEVHTIHIEFLFQRYFEWSIRFYIVVSVYISRDIWYLNSFSAFFEDPVIVGSSWSGKCHGM